jgi:hypothetical protein
VVRVPARLDRVLQARRSNGEFWTEVVLLAAVVLVVLGVVFMRVSHLAASLNAPMRGVIALW